MDTATPPGLIRRIVAFPLTLMIIGFVGLVGIGAGSSITLTRLFNMFDVARNSPPRFLVAVLVAGLLIAAYKAYKRWIEWAADRELELAGAPRELGLGLTLGAGLFAGMTGIVALLGGFEVLGVRGVGALWSMLGVAVFSGVFEEILFRGILFRHIEAMLGSWFALALTSALFGLAHIFNPGASWFSSLAIALEAGILLGAAYMLTRRLWLAIGIHEAWNLTQGWVFSVPVSGGEAPLGLLITRRVGPEWLTGGDFGLEASVMAMLVATLAGVLMLRRALANGQVVAPMWRR